jgi:peptidoglycan/LPS O-acetylase OafA/YrhL
MKRRKLKESREPPETKGRILFFDIIRILCVAAIVYDHSRFYLIPWFNQVFFSNGYVPLNIYPNGLQGYAVYGMIFVSGAVLEYNYQGIEKLTGYFQFLFRRFLRLYPAFWMSLVFTLLLFPFLFMQVNMANIFWEFTGFFIVLGKGVGYINPMGWFIGAIFSLYILFPWFSRIIRKYQLGAVIGFCILSWGLRFIILTYNVVPIDSFWRWFPLCNAFEFCLGIYLVRVAWYPKKENTYPFVRTLSDLSFYVFLYHFMVLELFMWYFKEPLLAFDTRIAMNIQPLSDTLFYLQIMISILAVSWGAMILDTRIRNWILQRDSVKKFLKA